MAVISGMTFTTLGGKIKQLVSGPTTNTLLIIGTAQDGPLNTPVRIDDAVSAEKIFGPASYSNGYLDPVTGAESGKYAGSTLPIAIAQALAAGCTDVAVVRASGAKASLTLGSGSYLSGYARNPGRIYNQQSVTLGVSAGTYSFTITQPLAKGGNVTLTGDATSTSLGELINQVNGSFANKVIDLDDQNPTITQFLGLSVNSLAAQITGTATFTGGTNGCFARGETFGPENFTAAGSGLFGYALGLVDSVTGTFESIRNQRFAFDVAVLTGINVDDQVSNSNPTSTTILNSFADFIYACSTEIRPCHGVMSVRSHGLRDDNRIIDYINGNLNATSYGYWNQSAKWLKAGPFLYTGRTLSGPNGTLMDVFEYVSVVAGPDVIYNHPDMGGDYNANPAVGIAALWTTIPPEQSTVQTALPGVKGYTKPFPQRYATALANGVGASLSQSLTGGGAYVVLVRDQIDTTGNLVINDDVTAGQRNGLFRSYQTRHITCSIQKDLQTALRPFLGKATGPGTKAAMEAAVVNVLEGYAQSEGLKGGRGVGYDFVIQMAGTDAALGIVAVNLELSVANAIRQIKLTVAVRQTQ